MNRPNWRDFDKVWTLSVSRSGVIHVAQVTKCGRKWRVKVQRTDQWADVFTQTVKTKREAQDIGAREIGFPVPEREKWTPTISQIRATAHIRGIEIDDEGDRYEAFAPKGKCFSGDLHSLISWYDEGDTASKREARRELFDDIKQPLEPCDPESDNCRACGCFTDSKDPTS